MPCSMVRPGRVLVALLAAGWAVSAAAGTRITSGLQVNERPRPFQVIDLTGPHRGQPHCYVCEAAGRPVVLIFARRITEPLARLIHKIDRAIELPGAELRSWVVFLTDHQGSHPEIEKLAERLAIRHVPLTVIEDAAGPPSYRIDRDAAVTLLLYKDRKVVANHAYRPGELSDAAVAQVLADLDKLRGGSKPAVLGDAPHGR